jgi:hypothetical protein
MLLSRWQATRPFQRFSSGKALTRRREWQIQDFRFERRQEVMDKSAAKKGSRQIVIALAALFASVSLVAGVGLWAVNHYYVEWEKSQDIPFDIKLWEAGSKAKIYSETALKIDAPRVRMCADFMANQPWKGKTKAELEAWLGKPDNFLFHGGWDFNYWVGLQRGPMKMDSAWLAFRFDGEGRCVEAKMMQD